MMEQSEQINDDFRSRVTKEAVLGYQTVEEIGDRFGVEADQVAAWKLHALDISSMLQVLFACPEDESVRLAVQCRINWRELHPFVSG